MITLSKVSKSFQSQGDGAVRRVLSNIDLNVPKGCLYGLIGPGASGKSVLLKIIAGLFRPDQGRVVVGGEDITSASELMLQETRRQFGMLFQNNALFDHLSVADNIAFPLRRLFDLPAHNVASQVAERLARVGLTGFESRLPGALSGGQKKRVGVARATVTRAPIVLYDEPAAGLDPVTSQKIFDLLRAEQQEYQTTVVMVSSDLDRLLTVTDRIGMIVQGELVFDGSTDGARASRHPVVRQFLDGLDEGPL